MARLLGRSNAFAHEKKAYERLRAKGFNPDAIIDVGSYHGEWAKLTHEVFEQAEILMVEAQPSKLARLEDVAKKLSGSKVVNAVLSGRSGETRTFYDMETGSSFLPERSNVSRSAREVVTQTLDSVANNFGGNELFLKIDVQGAELHVLEGAEKTLLRCAIVQLEVALLPYNEGAPTMREVLEYMEARSFVPIDVAGEIRLQGHLVQLDLLFARRNSPMRPDRIEF